MESTAKHFRKRDAILSCLRSTGEHPGAEWIYQHVRQDMPDISLATVYRNLAYFKEQGKILSLGTVGGVERFDGNTAPHVHFICTACGRILDLPGVEIPMELEQTAAQEAGGLVNGFQLSFTGLCRQCQAEKNPVEKTKNMEESE